MSTLEILVSIIATCHVHNSILMVMARALVNKAKSEVKENVHKEHETLLNNQKHLLNRIEQLEKKNQ